MLCIKSLFLIVVEVRIYNKKIRDAPFVRALRVINKLINTCARAIRTRARVNNSLITLSVYNGASRIFYTCSTLQAAAINTALQSLLCPFGGARRATSSINSRLVVALTSKMYVTIFYNFYHRFISSL